MFTKINNKKVIISASFALTSILGSSFLSTVHASRLNYAAIVYRDSHFGGSSIRIKPNQSYSNLGWMNDKISSLEVANGCKAKVYIDTYFQGTKTIFNAGHHSYVGDYFNDEISSVSVNCN